MISQTPVDGVEGDLKYKPQGDYDLLVIPKGFEEKILDGEKAQLEIYSSLKTLSMSGVLSSSGSAAAVTVINEMVSGMLLSQNLAGESSLSPDFLKNPVASSETTFDGRSFCSGKCRCACRFCHESEYVCAHCGFYSGDLCVPDGSLCNRQ